MRPQKNTHTQKENRKLILDKKSNLQPADEGLHPPNPDIPSLFFDQNIRKCYILIFHILKYSMLRYTVLRQQFPENTVFFFFIVFHTIHID